MDTTSPNADQVLLQAAIQQLIPHRYPFLFVDRVTAFVPGQRIAGVKHFTASDEVSQGNVAGLVPTTILIEMVTQLGAVLVHAQPHMAGKIAVILSIPSARLLKPVYTGKRCGSRSRFRGCTRILVKWWAERTAMAHW